MAEKKQTETNPLAVAKNIEDRIKTEQLAPIKWAAAYGNLFDNGVPNEYDARIAYFEEKARECPTTVTIPRYGVGEPFKEMGFKSYKRKKPKEEGEYAD